MERLKFMLIPYFLCGIMDTSTGSMRGIGSSVTPMIMRNACGLDIYRIRYAAVSQLFGIVYFLPDIVAAHLYRGIYFISYNNEQAQAGKVPHCAAG